MGDPRTSSDDLHELVSFDAPDEHRTWVFDLTFLTSRWTCIYGRGCPGVLTGPAPELEQGCCSYGAHLVDDADAGAVLAAADRLTDETWQHRRVAARRGGPLRGAPGRQSTRLVDGACIFLNRPGFAGGAGCALHRGALEAGERPLDWKPDVCWQLPLRLVEDTDSSGHVTSTVREWKRRDWGAGGFDFHWWCTDAPDAFVGGRPVYLELADELVELVGRWAYDRLVEHIEHVARSARDRTDHSGPVVPAGSRSARAGRGLRDATRGEARGATARFVSEPVVRRRRSG